MRRHRYHFVTALMLGTCSSPSCGQQEARGESTADDTTAGDATGPATTESSGEGTGTTAGSTTTSSTGGETGATSSGPTCGDGNVDPGEACDDGNRVDDDDCTNACQLPTCSDGIANGDETDVDCGGPTCPFGCGTGQACMQPQDCAGGTCMGTCVCTEWRISIDDPVSVDVGRDLATDNLGSLFVAASTYGTIPNAAGQGGAVYGRLAASGSVDWIGQLLSSEYDVAHAVARFSNGDIAVAGRVMNAFEGQVSVGLGDAFVARMTADGDLVWARQFGSSQNDAALTVAVAPDGRVHVGGIVEESMDGMPWAGGRDAFVAALDGDGNMLWRSQFGTAGDDAAGGVAVLPDGDVVFVGGAAGGVLGETGLGDGDGWIARLSPDGDAIWARMVGGTAADGLSSVAVAQDRLYVVGTSQGPVEGVPGNGGFDAMVGQLAMDGSTGWIRLFGSANDDNGRDLAVAGEDTVVIVGDTHGDIDGMTPAKGVDGYVAAFAASGTLEWVRLVQSASSSVDDFPLGVATDLGGGVYVIGHDRNNETALWRIFVQRLCP